MPKRKCGSVDASLGRNLTYFRKLAGLTQNQVAEKLNLNRTTYTKYETGASEPSIEILKQIAAILNVDVASILADEESAKVSDSQNDDLEGFEPELRNLIIGYRALPRDEREEVYKLINQLNV